MENDMMFVALNSKPVWNWRKIRMTHMHVTGWAVALILFIIALVMYNQGKAKPAKILHMILRLVYLFILYTGGDLIAHYFGGNNLLPEAIVKGLAGIWVIAAMEMILVR